MVLTMAQMTTFFEHANQMGIPHTTVIQLCAEEIEAVTDLADFDKDSLQQLTDNLRCPGGRPAGATIPTPPFVFGAKSQKHIAVACDLVRFYATVGRDLTAANLQWNTVMKNFEIQWKVLKEQKGDDSPDVPKISKALLVIKWMEAFQNFLNRKLETIIFHCRISFMVNPIHQQLHHPLLLANLIPLSMDPLNLSL